MSNEVLALIPARGGSKGVPRKNIRDVGGRPLVAWSIGHALAAKFVTRTVVSTDDKEIAQIAREWGAETPFIRPNRLAADDSLDFEVFQHALEWFHRVEGYEPDLVVQLRPTSPLRDPKRIDEAIELLLAHPDADSVRSVWPAIHSPYKMWRREGDWIDPLLTLPGVHEPYNQPRQALPQVWQQNGYVDVMRPAVILQQKSMSGRRILPFVIAESVPELDTEHDLVEAERILRELETH